MGGRGASSYKSVVNMTREELIKDLVKNYGKFTRGDLQGTVEAYAMVHNLSFREGDQILEEIDRKYDERIYYQNLLKVQEERLKETPKDADVTRDSIKNAIKHIKKKLGQ